MSTMKNCARIIFGILGVSFLGFRLDATVPAGYYYAADGKHGAELKTALYEIISSMHTLGYGSGEDATWEGSPEQTVKKMAVCGTGIPMKCAISMALMPSGACI